MNKVFRYALQIINYTLFMVVVWYFSIKPPYHQLEEDQAVIILSFTHATKIKKACRKLTQQELMKLAPNMRLPMDCPRERSPLKLELYLDDKLLAKSELIPLGIHKDQGVSMFKSIKVRAGKYSLRAWANDDVKVEGPTYKYKQNINIKAEQLLLLDFDAASGGFYIN